MDVDTAVLIVTLDLFGVEDREKFGKAFITLAYSDGEAGDVYDREKMKTSLAAALSDTLGGTHELVRAACTSESGLKGLLVRHALLPSEFVFEHLSQSKRPIESFHLAETIFATQDPSLPKYVEAINYLLKDGDDVPSEYRDHLNGVYSKLLASEEVGAPNDVKSCGVTFH